MSVNCTKTVPVITTPTTPPEITTTTEVPPTSETPIELDITAPSFETEFMILLVAIVCLIVIVVVVYLVTRRTINEIQESIRNIPKTRMVVEEPKTVKDGSCLNCGNKHKSFDSLPCSYCPRSGRSMKDAWVKEKKK